MGPRRMLSRQPLLGGELGPRRMSSRQPKEREPRSGYRSPRSEGGQREAVPDPLRGSVKRLVLAVLVTACTKRVPERKRGEGKTAA